MARLSAVICVEAFLRSKLGDSASRDGRAGQLPIAGILRLVTEEWVPF